MKEQILAVQRMQDHIEAHLEEDITLADLVALQEEKLQKNGLDFGKDI